MIASDLSRLDSTLPDPIDVRVLSCALRMSICRLLYRRLQPSQRRPSLETAAVGGWSPRALLILKSCRLQSYRRLRWSAPRNTAPQMRHHRYTPCRIRRHANRRSPWQRVRGDVSGRSGSRDRFVSRVQLVFFIRASVARRVLLMISVRAVCYAEKYINLRRDRTTVISRLQRRRANCNGKR